MDAAQALADLTEISSQIEAAVLFDAAGAVQGSTLADATAGEELVRVGAAVVTPLEASTREGSVFIVRDGDRGVVATTAPEPTVGLVFYDLKSCLGSAEAEPAPPKPRRRRRPAAKPAEGGDAT
jgi:hypothetical protein